MPSKLKVVPTKEKTIIDRNTDALEFKRITIESCSGIDRSNPVIVDFSEHGKDENITILSGDQGTGKTSTVNGILLGFGQSFDFKLENLYNNVDDNISVKSEFKKNGRHYMSLVSGDKFELKKMFRDADDPDAAPVWQKQDTPKTLIKELIGHVATSPMFLKEEKDGEKQVKWLLGLLNVPEDVKKKQIELKNALDTVIESRKNANREFVRIGSALSQNDFYENWEKSEKNYKEVKTIEGVKNKLNEVDLRRQKFSRAENELSLLKKGIKRQDQEISEMEAKLELLKKTKASDEKRVATGEKFIQENKGVNSEYETVYKDFEEINAYVINRERWLDVVRLKSEKDSFESAVITLDAQKDKLRNDSKALLKSILPPIDGLEVEIEDSIEKKHDVGIYIYGKTPAQISESELFEFYLKVLETQKIGMVVIENITSLGSSAIEVINHLAKTKGIRVFATMMDRSQKDRAISFTTSIE